MKRDIVRAFPALTVMWMVTFLGFHFSTRSIWEHLELFAPQKAGIWTTEQDGNYTTIFFLKPGKNETPIDSNYECILSREGEDLKKAELTPVPNQEHRYACAWGKLFIGMYDVRVVQKGKTTEPEKLARIQVEGPNLRVPASWIQVAPMKPMKGKSFTVRVSVLNNGSKPAKNVLVRIQMYREGTPASSPKAAEVDDLNPGKTATVAFEVPGLPHGKYEIRASVDPANDIDELYEKDNESSREIWVSQKLLLR